MKLFLVVLFSISFAFVESSVVVYLRSIYYPEGFAFPLKIMSASHIWVESVRELSTIIMLAAVGILAGTSRWQRFAFFVIVFGIWDIFYYVWLKVILDWPASLLDWDVLFLIPLPWIGPVIAPVVISALLVLAGGLILRWEATAGSFHPPVRAWVLATLGSVMILFSFMVDTEATLRFQPPQPYRYELFLAGCTMYLAALYFSFGDLFRRRA